MCKDRVILVIKRFISLLTAIFTGACSDVAANGDLQLNLQFETPAIPALDVLPTDGSPELLEFARRARESVMPSKVLGDSTSIP